MVPTIMPTILLFAPLTPILDAERDFAFDFSNGSLQLTADSKARDWSEATRDKYIAIRRGKQHFRSLVALIQCVRIKLLDEAVRLSQRLIRGPQRLVGQIGAQVVRSICQHLVAFAKPSFRRVKLLSANSMGNDIALAI